MHTQDTNTERTASQRCGVPQSERWFMLVDDLRYELERHNDLVERQNGLLEQLLEESADTRQEAAP